MKSDESIAQFLPSAVVVLRDGVERTFRWDMNALIEFQFQLQKEAKEDRDKSLLPNSIMRCVLWAGLISDAEGRNERSAWTIARVGSLMPLKLEELNELGELMNKVRQRSEDGPGGVKASAGAAEKRPTRVTGKKR